MRRKSLTTLADYVIYSYTLTYQMYLNAQEEAIFEKCIDSRMISDPADYCLRTVAPTINLTLWTDSNEYSACKDGAQVIQ